MIVFKSRFEIIRHLPLSCALVSLNTNVLFDLSLSASPSLYFSSKVVEFFLGRQ